MKLVVVFLLMVGFAWPSWAIRDCGKSVASMGTDDWDETIPAPSSFETLEFLVNALDEGEGNLEYACDHLGGEWDTEIRPEEFLRILPKALHGNNGHGLRNYKRLDLRQLDLVLNLIEDYPQLQKGSLYNSIAREMSYRDPRDRKRRGEEERDRDLEE